MEADSGGGFNREADFGGILQYGGGFWGQIYLWRRILEAIVLLGVYIKGMSRAFFSYRRMLGGGLTYGGGFWRRIPIWRRIPGAYLIWRQISVADFNYGRRFILHGGRFFSHVKAKPFKLCRRSSTRGGLHKSI
jgi:hypothetical protein